MTKLSATRVAVIGASGYAGEELLRLLLAHSKVDLVAVTSRQFAGESIATVFPRFCHNEKARQLRFRNEASATLAQEAELIFLALPHGLASEFARPLVESGTLVIDLSADFRIRDVNVYREFYKAEHPAPELLGRAVYGLPEFYRDAIREATLVACPGCYPTSILLPMLPLVREGIVNYETIVVSSLSGVTGAGRKVEPDYLFAECNESCRPYGVPKHRHLSEIEQELSSAAAAEVIIQFVPHLVPVNRGIISTIFLNLARNADSDKVAAVYAKAFGDEPFVRLLGGTRLPDTKNVIGTNFIDIAWKVDERTNRLIVMSAIDNLVKGTGGQALQCMNLMCGYPETAGLI